MVNQVTATQLGAIGENLAANGLIVASDGRLAPFSPVADDGGIDLLVYDKVTGRAVPLQVKTRTGTLRGHPQITHFEVRKATFTEHPEGFLLAVLFELESLEVRRAWLPTLDPRRGERYNGIALRVRPGGRAYEILATLRMW